MRAPPAKISFHIQKRRVRHDKGQRCKCNGSGDSGVVARVNEIPEEGFVHMDLRLAMGNRFTFTGSILTQRAPAYPEYRHAASSSDAGTRSAQYMTGNCRRSVQGNLNGLPRLRNTPCVGRAKRSRAAQGVVAERPSGPKWACWPIPSLGGCSHLRWWRS